jgi:hypothetical protein
MTILRTPADVAGEAAPLPVYTPLLRALLRSTSSADVWGAAAEALFDRARRGLWVITAQPTEVLFGRLTALTQDLGALRGEGIATLVIAPGRAGDPALASRLAATIDRLSTTLAAAQPGRGGTPGVSWCRRYGGVAKGVLDAVTVEVSPPGRIGHTGLRGDVDIRLPRHVRCWVHADAGRPLLSTRETNVLLVRARRIAQEAHL